MEKLQQLLQQQQQQQQQIQNQLYQNSFRLGEQPPREEDEEEEEEETGEEDIEEEDESLQEFLQPQSQQQKQQSQEQQSRRLSKPELPAAQEQLLQQKLSELQSSSGKKQPAPEPPIQQQQQQQQESKKPEFSVRHQPIPQPVSQQQQQQPSKQGQKSQAPPPPPTSAAQQQQQPAAMLNGDHLKHDSELTKSPIIQVNQFDRKFRNSWRKSPEDFTTKQQQQQMVMKKASKLSENDISSQADEEEEGDITEDDVYRLHDELEHANLQNNEMKKALNEARTIIDQQQNQLTEFRRLAAQYQTDTEAFKMKSMFLLNNTQTRDEQVTVLMDACERLEAEIDALTWQLDQAKHSLDLKTQECDFLNEQLDEIQLNAGSNSTINHQNNNNTNNNLMNGNGHHDPDHIIAGNMDKANTGTDQLRSTLSTEYRSIIGNNHTGHINTMSTGLNMNGANDLSLHMELQKLQEELEVYRKKEEDWEKIHVELLQRQKILEEEKKQQELVIGRLAGEQVAKNKAENPQDNDVENDIPLEIVATLNNLHEEKTTWKLYASSLVRSFVENCEEFIRKTPYNEPYFESDGERRWYAYSMHLLENLLHVAPYMLAKTDLDLLKRTTTKTVQQKRNPYLSGGGGGVGLGRYSATTTTMQQYEPQLITTSDFPLSASQTQLQNRNMSTGQLATSEFVQLSASSASLAQPTLAQSSMLGQEQQLYTQMSYPTGMSTQKNMSERAARAASKSITDLYRKKKQR
uniref:Uncharacterized protein n=1 Tax=Trichobilharzia regenti TaxID=157069 RepID=A0AA85J5G5_TRIRE|nr:unnamed protein product [Trichobilharzia regenti]